MIKQHPPRTAGERALLPGEEGAESGPKRLGRREGDCEGERSSSAEAAFSLSPRLPGLRSGRRSRRAVPGVSASLGSAPPPCCATPRTLSAILAVTCMPCEHMHHFERYLS